MKSLNKKISYYIFQYKIIPEKLNLGNDEHIDLLHAVYRGEVRFVRFMNSEKFDSGNHDRRTLQDLISSGLVNPLKVNTFLTKFVLTDAGYKAIGIDDGKKKESCNILQ